MNESEIKTFLKSMYSYVESTTLDEISDFCDYLKLSKGTELIKAGKRHHFFYFIIQGSVKSYHLKEEKEICTWFAFEKELVSTIKTFEGHPSNETIKLLEDSEFIRINTKAFKTLTESKISINRVINELITEHAIFLEDLLYLQSKSGKERYEYLIKTEPQLIQRVSLTDLASFLGMSRETLSRIRSKR
ncbi:MAG: CRP-like cAMP-binding protein [Saprospiraceae bacterium]|jgi:CRP-like cAMP-binding protein